MLVLLLMAVTGTWAEGKTIDLSTVSKATTAEDGDVLTGTLANKVQISIADGARVTLDNVSINGTNSSSYYWAGITCEGDATIVLADGSTNEVRGFYEGCPGIHIAKGKTLTIRGKGSLTVSSNDVIGNGGGAGIGAGWGVDCGNIIIEDGIIIVTGGTSSAGIGGSNSGSCGNISITGGNITAKGGGNGAGIGGGIDGSCGNIFIMGGTVNATGGEFAAAIGSGTNSLCGNITITNNVTLVTATKHDSAPYSIGKGLNATCGTVTIGGVVTGNIADSPYTYSGGTAVSLTLTDNVDNSLTLTTYNGYKANVAITGRMLYKDGDWNTLCLPFNIADISTSTLAGATIMELDIEGTHDGKKTGFDATNSTLYLYFKDASNITAGKPYIVRWGTPDAPHGGTIENPTFSDVTINGSGPEPITSKDKKVCFKGNYDLVTLTGGDKSTFYLGSGNKLYYPSEDRTINAFRGYFQLTGSQSVRSFVLNFGGNDDTTGIVEVDSGQRTVDSWSDAWFDLQGRKLSGKPTQKGVYIHNGKKRAVR